MNPSGERSGVILPFREILGLLTIPLFKFCPKKSISIDTNDLSWSDEEMADLNDNFEMLTNSEIEQKSIGQLFLSDINFQLLKIS